MGSLTKFSPVFVTFFESLLHHLPNYIYLGISLWGSHFIMKKLLDPTRNKRLQLKKVADKVLKHLRERRQSSGSSSIPQTLDLNEYEVVIASDIVNPENMTVSFEDIGGLEEIKGQLQESIIWPLVHPELYETSNKLLLSSIPRGVLLYGRPGTGKTMLAKALAKSCSAAFINLNISTVYQKWYGESEKYITAVFSLAEKIQPSIIFVDEIDGLFGKRSDSDHEVTLRMKTLFMSLWDGLSSGRNQRITVIGATNRPWEVDEAVLRRMPQSYFVPLPNVSQRKTILQLLLKDTLCAGGDFINTVATDTEGYTGSDLHALSSHAMRGPIRDALQSRKDGSLNSVLRAVTVEDFRQAQKAVARSRQVATIYKSFVNYQQFQEEQQLLFSPPVQPQQAENISSAEPLNKEPEKGQ